MSHANLTNPRNYPFIQIPLPILQCRPKQLSDFQKIIYGVFYTAQQTRWKLSMRGVADQVRAALHDPDGDLTPVQRDELRKDRDNVRRSMRRAMDDMEEKHFLQRTRRRKRSGTQVIDVELFVPESIHATAERHLLGSVELEEDDDEAGGASSPNRGGFKSGLGGTPGPSPLDHNKISSKIPTAPPLRSKGGDAPLPDAKGGEEEELTPNPDGGSRTVAESTSPPRVAKPKAGDVRSKPRVKKQAPSGKECRRTPSQRWEFTRWRDLPPKEWRASDLVGYWVCRFLEVRGEEDGQLFSVDVHGMAPLLRNVKRFTDNFHDGDFIPVKGVVDKILERAEDLGMPCSLRFFLTPSSEGNVQRLYQKQPKRKRELTQHEKNNIGGTDREYWDKRAAEECRRYQAANGGRK